MDDEDFEYLNQWTWYVRRDRNRFYATGYSKSSDQKYVRIDMHRAVLRLTTGDGIRIDHINGNGLDNRKENLRIASRAENGMNRGKFAKTSSRYKGVRWHKCEAKWNAQIKSKGRYIYLGSYSNEEDAARAYDKAATEHFGSFARLNFSENLLSST